jgi:hypothetical protein
MSVTQPKFAGTAAVRRTVPTTGLPFFHDYITGQRIRVDGGWGVS